MWMQKYIFSYSFLLLLCFIIAPSNPWMWKKVSEKIIHIKYHTISYILWEDIPKDMEYSINVSHFMRRSKFWHWKFCSKMVPSLCVRLAPARGRSQSEPGSGQRVTSMRVNIRNTHIQKTLIFIYCFVTSLFLVGKVHTFKLLTFGWDINNLHCELYHSVLRNVL